MKQSLHGGCFYYTESGNGRIYGPDYPVNIRDRLRRHRVTEMKKALGFIAKKILLPIGALLSIIFVLFLFLSWQTSRNYPNAFLNGKIEGVEQDYVYVRVFETTRGKISAGDLIRIPIEGRENYYNEKDFPDGLHEGGYVFIRYSPNSVKKSDDLKVINSYVSLQSGPQTWWY